MCKISFSVGRPIIIYYYKLTTNPSWLVRIHSMGNNEKWRPLQKRQWEHPFKQAWHPNQLEKASPIHQECQKSHSTSLSLPYHPILYVLRKNMLFYKSIKFILPLHIVIISGYLNVRRQTLANLFSVKLTIYTVLYS